MTYISRSTDHRYTFDGVTYPGVTGILRIIDKSDALMSWASRMTAEAAISLGDTFPQLLANVGPEGVLKALTARSAWQRDEAASKGSLIHGLADQLIRGEQPVIPDSVRKHLEHYVGWYNASGWTLRASEALLVNTEWGYGGTLDLLCKDRDGKTVLADIKTGKAIYAETVLQLAAYGSSTWLDKADGKIYRMPVVDRYVILHVTAEGVREVEVAVGSAELAAFRACITLSAWRETMKGKRL